ncbi:hypothetical protein [Facklamia sp. 7083-14-GEN3]|uniref:hypothetical protein n=1 Tax=Facklamia sp. 7083-14-GEN3 TaxID=2973478 RepID=UPI00215C3505|nr:hypothetical protein [Facklamia sp. 7083-14-GEN3]MCR8969984.1 hypothetical protein [Facklamia sp. 7083-14-GEN3]
MNKSKKIKVFFLMLMVNILLIPQTYINGQEKVSDAWQDVAEKVNQQEFQSFHMKGTVGVKISSQNMTSDFGNLEIDTLVSNQPIALQMVAKIVSPFVGSEAVGFETYAKEGFNYTYNTETNEWTTSEWTVSEEEILESLQASFENVSNELAKNEITPESQDFINKYFTLEEKGQDYHFKLKKDIDGATFYNDLDKAIDLKQLVQESADKAIEQSEDFGQAIDQNYEKSLEELLNPEKFKEFFNMNPQMSVTYDSLTGLIKNFSFMIDMNPKVFVDSVSEVDQSNLPELISISASFDFDQYGETFNIQVPLEAMQTSEENSTED